MCGVFGFVSFDGKGPSIKRLEKIAAVTERRGRHAFGFAWVDSKGRIKSFKATGKITDHLNLLSLAHDAQFLIGHCRWATHGSADNNLNNHPHPVDGGWFVHNGVIADHHQIVKENDLHPVTECDSETLGLLIEAGEGRLKTRCVEAVQYASGSPLVFLGVWSKPGRLIALRSGNPLSLGLCKGRAYLASLQEGLVGRIVQVEDNHGIDFSGGKMTEIQFSRNANGVSGPADDSDDDAEPDPLEFDLDDEPVAKNVKHVQGESVAEWKARHDAETVTVAKPTPCPSEDDGRGIPADWKPNKTKEKIESYWQGVRKKRRAGRLEGLDIRNAEVYGIDYAYPDDHAALADIAHAAKITQQQLDAMDRADWRGILVLLKDGTAQLSRSGKVKFTDDQLTRLNRGFERNLERLSAKPNGLVPIPGTAGGDVPQPKKPPAPKLKPKLRGGLGQQELWN